MDRVILPVAEPLSTGLSEALARRRSHSVFRGPLSLPEWGTLLGNALGVREEGRSYPSGGALYPIETYVICEDGELGGIFHYHPKAHALERLGDVPPGTLATLVPKPEHVKDASVILFTAFWDRSAQKYGDFTYLLALLEAGHMSENVLLSAAAMSLASRPLAGFNDALASELLDIGEEEQGVLAIVVAHAL